jgi:hypothetical protein
MEYTIDIHTKATEEDLVVRKKIIAENDLKRHRVKVYIKPDRKTVVEKMKNIYNKEKESRLHKRTKFIELKTSTFFKTS